MQKVIGYGVSVVGIFLMALGFGLIPINLGFLEGVGENIMSGVGIVLVVVGVILSMNKKSGEKVKVKGGEDEVPIYEGVGKKRRIVGYRKG